MIESLFRILALMRKEMLAMFKDPKSRFSLILPTDSPVPDLRLRRHV